MDFNPVSGSSPLMNSKLSHVINESRGSGGVVGYGGQRVRRKRNSNDDSMVGIPPETRTLSSLMGS
jgi:hypothetical protein